MFRAGPSLQFRRAYFFLWLLAYLAIYYGFKESLPEKYGRDAGFLADVMEIGRLADTSFSTMAAIYGALPGWFLPHLPAFVGGVSLWVILSYVRSYQTMLLLFVLLPPYLLLNFLYPSKETLVAIMALAVYAACRKIKGTLPVFLVILALYVPYGIFIRQYYLLILAVFTAIFLIMRTNSIVWMLLACAGIVALALIPNEVYFQIQSPRDAIYAQLSSGSNLFVRTCFPNPLPPDNAFNFLVNTLYGLLVLFVPFIIGQSVNEVLLLINVAAYAAMVYYGLKHMRGGAQLPYMLFIGHILTQAQFEPDLGSYMRHFSSVFVLIAPALPFLFAPQPVQQKDRAAATIAA